jgi:DNA-binding HxlR family transcriptional regulator
MAVFDLLGRSWALGVVWQLQGGPYTFRELRDRCETISPSILNSRIKDLTKAQILERTLRGYQLTPRGAQLIQILRPVGDWSRQWAHEVFQVPMTPKEPS